VTNLWPSEVAIVSNYVMQTLHFKSPYSPYLPEDNGDDDEANFNGLSWQDGIIEYANLFTALKETTSNFALVYSYGREACEFLHNLLQIPIHDLKTRFCPHPHKLNSKYTCYLTCHKNYSDVRCATKHTHALYKCLEYHFQTKRYVRCPKGMSRHTANFFVGKRQIL